MTLVKVFFLVGLLFGPTGEIERTGSMGAYRTLADCNAERVAVIQAPPAGLAPNVGLVCAEVEVPVTRVGS